MYQLEYTQSNVATGDEETQSLGAYKTFSGAAAAAEYAAERIGPTHFQFPGTYWTDPDIDDVVHTFKVVEQ